MFGPRVKDLAHFMYDHFGLARFLKTKQNKNKTTKGMVKTPLRKQEQIAAIMFRI